MVQQGGLKPYFDPLLAIWDKIGEQAVLENEAFTSFVELIRKGESSIYSDLIGTWIENLGLGSPSISDDLAHVILRFIPQKAQRIRRIEELENRKFTQDELLQHWETALKSGFYFFLRSKVERQELWPPEEYIAAWFLVRELCYGSMFRYNRAGKFNIPYGGIAYNRKDLKVKSDYLFSKELALKLSGVRFFNLDFSDFIQIQNPGKNDFIFLDPPYDSEFSEYDRQSFTKEDQIRLAELLNIQVSKWMLVIKETPFIRSLYQKSGIYITGFDKTYMYNVRGRNERGVRHLIITNYNPSGISFQNSIRP